MAKCDLCGKAKQFGSQVSHSKRHTNRVWMPNVHTASLLIDGKRKRFDLCTRCLRTQHKLGH